MVDTHDSKMTVLGTLPIDWEVSNIQDCFQKNEKIKIGPFGSQLKKEYLLPRGDYYVYGQENVYQDDFHICYRFLSFERFNSLKSCEIRPGDFVVSTMGTIGKCAVVPDYAHVGIMDSHLVRMRFNDSLFKPFFAYLFRSRIIQEQIRKLSVGGIMEGLSTSILKKIDVIVPPIQEQKRIASALSTIDSLICELDEAISKKRHIKEGLMRRLLTPQTGSKWVERLGRELFSIGNGRDYKSLGSGSIPVYGTGGLMASVDDFLYDGPTVCIGRKGTIDRPQYHEGKIWTVDTLFYTYDFKGVNPKFLYYLFCRVNWHALNEATGVPSLTSNNILNVCFLLPSEEEEQRSIVTILDAVEDEIVALDNKRQKYSLIKKGMMQELLTGKTRLI